MKRLIKYYNKYQNDGIKFSDCSTEREILPVIVSDETGIDELKLLVAGLGYSIGTCHEAETPKYGFRDLTVTHAIQIGTKRIKGWSRYDSIEEVPEYLGFITIPKGPLLILETIDNDITEEQISEILNNQAYGVSDIGETVDGETVLVKSGWDNFHALAVNGYSRDKFIETAGITEEGFEDDTIRCGSCYKFDSRDNGYTYNHRWFGECDLLGVRCGCYDEACENEYHSFVNEAEKCMELKTARTLETKGILEHVQRYIGGMVDGRGGYYSGEIVPEGEPSKVLAELLKSDPEGEYIFSHDESGQFQSYFSVWRVLT